MALIPGRKKSKNKSVNKDDFLPLLVSEFRRLGLSVQIDGQSKADKDLIWKLCGFLLDMLCCATVAGDRLALNGLGTFWVTNGIIKFRASKRYKRALQGFMNDVCASEDFKEKFRQFEAYLKTQDSAKTQRQQTINRLVELTPGG